MARVNKLRGQSYETNYERNSTGVSLKTEEKRQNEDSRKGVKDEIRRRNEIIANYNTHTANILN